MGRTSTTPRIEGLLSIMFCIEFINSGLLSMPSNSGELSMP